MLRKVNATVALDDSNDVAIVSDSEVVAGRRKSPTKGRTLGKKMEQSSKYEWIQTELTDERCARYKISEERKDLQIPKLDEI